ncbi:MAG: LLM class flavin-dependent oxidoreductase [Candidatus Promineofilum sp.]|nr:LLM class flavin-dependent oxidoreductase [Promineifilum sp.]
MEFGFGHHLTEDYRGHIGLAQLGEQLGFDFFWLPDQTFFPDPYIMLGLVGQATQRIQIGLAVTNPHTRHPATSARSIGTLALTAPNRVHIAIGAGNNKEMLTPLGLDGSHAGTKIREMVEISHGLLSGEKIDYHGKYFKVAGVRLDVPPPGNVPIYIAGRGSYVLQTAGEVADGVIIGAICNQKGITHAIDQVKIGAARSNRDISQLRIVSWLTVILTKDRASALQQVRRSVAHIIGGAPNEILQSVGMDDGLARKIKDVYWTEGIPQAAKHVTDECVDTFAMVGDAQMIIERIKTLRDAGVNQLSINLGDDRVDNFRAQITKFAESIFPAFA